MNEEKSTLLVESIEVEGRIRSEASQREQQVWNVLKYVPVVNSTYGLVRTIVQFARGHNEEGCRTFGHTLGGVASVAAGFGGAMISVAAAPVLLPTVCAVTLGGLAGQVVGGGGEVIVDAVTNPELRPGTGGSDAIETNVNNQIVKDVPILGIVYSLLSAGIYWGKGNREERNQRVKNAGVGIVTSAVLIGTSYGIAKLVSRLTARTGAKNSAAPKTIEDVATKGIPATAEGLGDVGGLGKVRLAAGKLTEVKGTADVLKKMVLETKEGATAVVGLLTGAGGAAVAEPCAQDGIRVQNQYQTHRISYCRERTVNSPSDKSERYSESNTASSSLEEALIVGACALAATEADMAIALQSSIETPEQNINESIEISSTNSSSFVATVCDEEPPSVSTGEEERRDSEIIEDIFRFCESNDALRCFEEILNDDTKFKEFINSACEMSGVEIPEEMVPDIEIFARSNLKHMVEGNESGDFENVKEPDVNESDINETASNSDLPEANIVDESDSNKEKEYAISTATQSTANAKAVGFGLVGTAINLITRKGVETITHPAINMMVSKSCEMVARQVVEEQLKEKVFPYIVPNLGGFSNCLTYFDKIINEGDEKTHRKLISYLVNCFCQDGIVDESNGDPDNNFLVLACRTNDVAVIQSILAFWPPVLRSYDPDRLERINQEFETYALSIPKYIWKMVTDSVDSALGDLEPKIPNELKFVHEKIPIVRANQENGNGLRLLALDGGGTKGLIALEILANIEKCTGICSIKDNFDWLCGTSTGGIILLYIALENRTISDCRKIYFRLKNEVFRGPKPYSTVKFEKLLKEFFPEHKVMADIVGVRIMITTTTGPELNLELKTFTNYDEETKNTPIWKVARMTSAAPSFFDYFEHEDGGFYYDGGLIANNPTETLYGAAQNFGSLKNATIVSVGTGKVPVDEKIGLKVNDSTFGLSKMVYNGTLDTLVKMMAGQSTKTDGEVVKRMMSTAKGVDCFYARLTPSLPHNMDLDETDDVKLVNAIWHAKAFANIHKNVFEEVAQRLQRGPPAE